MPPDAAVRLRKELQDLRKKMIPHLLVEPDGNDLLTWYFVVHNLPADTPYHKGIYLGRLVFPKTYPFAPPSILMHTPNLRFDINVKLCFSFSDRHPESWSPSWRIDTLLIGFVSYMLDESEGPSLGLLHNTFDERKQAAAKSLELTMNMPIFKKYFSRYGFDAIEESKSASESAREFTSVVESKYRKVLFIGAELSQHHSPRLPSAPYRGSGRELGSEVSNYTSSPSFEEATCVTRCAQFLKAHLELYAKPSSIGASSHSWKLSVGSIVILFTSLLALLLAVRITQVYHSIPLN